MYPNVPNAYYIRANIEYDMGAKATACLDYKKARELGLDKADEMLNTRCK
jgi:hypothetical protein